MSPGSNTERVATRQLVQLRHLDRHVQDKLSRKPSIRHWRPHSSLGYQTPAAYAEMLTATGSSATQIEGSAPPLVAHPAPNGVTETVEACLMTFCADQTARIAAQRIGGLLEFEPVEQSLNATGDHAGGHDQGRIERMDILARNRAR